MTRIDFYILENSDNEARWRFACRLTEKAYQQGHRVYLHVDSAAEAQRLDDLLWTFRGGSFIPHTAGAHREEDPEARVHVGHGADPLGHDDVLVNLGRQVPPFFSRFQRVAELVDGDEEQRRVGRERYRYYRDRGYTLESHTIKAEPNVREG
jgi:DNA polymerase-3 subunit chi